MENNDGCPHIDVKLNADLELTFCRVDVDEVDVIELRLMVAVTTNRKK